MMFKILKPINDPRAEAQRKRSAQLTRFVAKMSGAEERKAAALEKRGRRAAKRSRDAEHSAEGHKWSTALINPDNWHVRPRAEP